MARLKVSALDNPVSTDNISSGASLSTRHGERTSTISETEGLKLSPIKSVPTRDLTASAHNTVFESAKDEKYWANLEQDIRDANAIIDPLVATKSNVLLSGHSRLQIARKLLEEGNKLFDHVPVRYVQNEITDQETKKRVYLSNLNRFEIDPDTRIRLRAEIYPDFYNEAVGKRGRKDTATAAAIAESSKVSMRNIQREKALHLTATRIADEVGRESPTDEDYRKARAETKSGRTTRSTASKRSRSFRERQIRETLAVYESRSFSDSPEYGVDPGCVAYYVWRRIRMGELLRFTALTPTEYIFSVLPYV